MYNKKRTLEQKNLLIIKKERRGEERSGPTTNFKTGANT